MYIQDEDILEEEGSGEAEDDAEGGTAKWKREEKKRSRNTAIGGEAEKYNGRRGKWRSRRRCRRRNGRVEKGGDEEKQKQEAENKIMISYRKTKTC